MKTKQEIIAEFAREHGLRLQNIDLEDCPEDELRGVLLAIQRHEINHAVGRWLHSLRKRGAEG